MKKTAIALALGSTLLSGVALADHQDGGEHNILVGFSNGSSTLTDDFDLKGLNFKYGFEPYGQNTGFISSINHASDSDASKKMSYSSLMMGPSYYVTDFAAVYAMGGIGILKQKTASMSEEDTGFATSVGFKMNVYKDFVLDTNIEYTPIDLEGKTSDVTSFTVSIGGRF